MCIRDREYGATPPPPFTTANAVLLPAQSGLFTAKVVYKESGTVTVYVFVTVHRFASFTVTVYVPPAMPTKFWVVAELLQVNVYGEIPPATPIFILPELPFPVSYTHLDVYKRQAYTVWYLSSSSGSTSLFSCFGSGVSPRLYNTFLNFS